MSNLHFAVLRDRTYALWRELLPDVPLLLSLRTDDFQGLRVRGTDLGIGKFGGEWVLVHIHADNQVSVNAGPFDFPEQAVAALFAAVIHHRALALLRTEAFNLDA
jgi:hypothetical protein